MKVKKQASSSNTTQGPNQVCWHPPINLTLGRQRSPLSQVQYSWKTMRKERGREQRRVKKEGRSERIRRRKEGDRTEHGSASF